MNHSTIRNKNLIIFGIPLLMLVSLVLLSNSQIFRQNISSLSIATTIDLVFTIPIVYFFLIRKSNIDKKTIVPFFFVGLITASFILPKENQTLLSGIKTWIVPLVEIVVISLVLFKVYKATRIYKEKKEQSLDIVVVIRETCASIFPKKAASFISLEILSFYYGFLHWRKISLKENEFTYHKNTGSQTLFVAIIFLIAIETVAFHSLFMRWSPIVAWILTGISIYSAFQIFGFLKSLSKRPIVIEKNILKLHYGILREVDIPVNHIAAIAMTTKSIEDTSEKTTYLSLLGDSEGHNIVISLNKEHTLTGVYGTRKKFTKIALNVDEKEAFVKQLKSLQAL